MWWNQLLVATCVVVCYIIAGSRKWLRVLGDSMDELFSSIFWGLSREFLSCVVRLGWQRLHKNLDKPLTCAKVQEHFVMIQKFLWNQSKNIDLMYLTIGRLYPPNIPHMRPIAFVGLIWSMDSISSLILFYSYAWWLASLISFMNIIHLIHT
jgi:hypothetical protein